MAKGQKRSNREVKKPKKTTKTIAPPASVFDASRQAANKKPPTEPKPARP